MTPYAERRNAVGIESSDWFGSVYVHARTKSRRTRIKEHRAKRHRRRFYVCLADGKERARDTGVRKPFVPLPLPNNRDEPRSPEQPLSPER